MHNATILIVDDEQLIRWSLASRLKQDGHRTLEAATAAEALALHREGVDLVLLDIGLPDASGLSVLRQVKEFDPDTLVVMLTAQTGVQTAVEAMKNGAFHYANKPFDLDEISLLVEKALGLDPFAPCAYVFSNRRRNRVKILGWDRNGYWLLLKRLEQDRFIWPAADTVPTLTVEQLHWLLDGIDIAVVQRHPQRIYERVA